MNFVLKWIYRLIYLTKKKLYYPKCFSSKRCFPNKCTGGYGGRKDCPCAKCPYYDTENGKAD